MPSPFPGMDPYLEPHWLDVHTKLVAFSSEALNEQLPPDLIARSEERIAVEAGTDARSRAYFADVRVSEGGRGMPESGDAPGGIAIDAPLTMVLDFEYPTQRSVRIEGAGGTLITVIEFISPWNKRRPGRKAYRTKRRQMLSAGVHVVEVDLVRTGDWRSLARPYHVPAAAETPYRVMIYEAKHAKAHLFPIGLQDALPMIPIPLRPHDPRVTLALQPLLERTYRGGRYERTVDYAREPDPPLSNAANKWTDAMLRNAGRR